MNVEAPLPSTLAVQRWGMAFATLGFGGATVAHVWEGASLGSIMFSVGMATVCGLLTQQAWRRR